MADLVVYGSKMSPFVRKVEAVLRYKQLDFDFEEINIMDQPDWYREMHPLKRVPTLRNRAVAAEGPSGTIPDSSAICGYLEKYCPEPALYPADPYAYGRSLWLEEYVDTSIAAIGGFGIFRAVMMPLFAGGEPDIATARETWNKKLPKHFDYLESQLDGQQYFVGESFSIADIAVGAQMLQTCLIVDGLNAERWPALVSHLNMIEAHPAFKPNLEFCNTAIRTVLPEKLELV